MVYAASIFLVIVATVSAASNAQDTGSIRALQGGAKEDVCHFPPGNPANFKTLSVGQSAVAKHLERGDWLGSCEDNCVDICTSEDSPIFGSGVPIEDCLEKCGVSGGLAVLVTENTGDLTVLSCDASSIEIQGSRADEVSAGKFFIYLEGDLTTCSTPCSPLFRKIVSVVEEGGTKILSTEFATAAEILGENTVQDADDFNETPLEPLAGCSHSGTGARKLQLESSTDDMSFLLEATKANRELQQGSCRPNWLLKNADGRCRHTNCFVGTDGDPNDCFQCKTSCDNTCGPDGGPTFSGNLILFDFGPACCNHDHCWSSNTFTRQQCDVAFYRQMKDECPPLIVSILSLIVGLPTGVNVVLGSCDVIAAAFYLAVSKTNKSDQAYADAQAKQKAYELTDVCVAQCPSTQRSGGQGTTTLTVDLLQDSGTFQVSYQMYTIPDRLYIEYEGTRIFDTGGLVSGSRTVNVAYSGTSTIVQVTMEAPNSGTAWDVTVNCPL